MEHQQASKTDQLDHQVQIPSSSPPAQFDRAPVHGIQRLQRLAGNQAVQRLIQTKMTIGRPGDQYEQEADRVADAVMRMPQRRIRPKPT